MRDSTGFLSLAVGVPSPRGDGMLVGGTCSDPEYQLESLLFADVSNPAGNLLILSSSAASHARDFQVFTTSQALICVCFKQISMSFPGHSLALH